VQNGCGVEGFLPKDPPKFSRGLSYFRPPRRVRRATKNSYAEWQIPIFLYFDYESCSTIAGELFQVRVEHGHSVCGCWTRLKFDPYEKEGGGAILVESRVARESQPRLKSDRQKGAENYFR
jgi:hypothetical protein